MKAQYCRSLIATGALILAALPTVVTAQDPNSYTQQNLLSDTGAQTPNTDPNLINPWGASFSPGGPFWISNNGTGTIAVYNGQGLPFP